MTYSELLHSVNFDDLIPYIKKYAGSVSNLANYKIHYDILCHIIPKIDEEKVEYNENHKKVKITNGEVDPFMPKPHLDVYPIEGCTWESALARELDIASDVDATKEEIAACCLWHTSFYGFTRDQVEETGQKLEYYGENLLDNEIDRIEAQKLIQRMQTLGVRIPSRKDLLRVPSFHARVKKRIWRHRIHQRESRKWFGNRSSWRKVARRVIQWEYHKYIKEVAPFVLNTVSPMASQEYGFSANDLSNVFMKNKLLAYSYRSYCYDVSKRAQWMMDLIEKYNAFNQGTRHHHMLCIGHHPDYPLSSKDYELFEFIKNKFKGEYFVSHIIDKSLEQDISLSIAFYE